MFEGWDNFYLIIGGAAGALIGLMFVVATLSHGRDRAAALDGASLYMTPTVVGFSVVMVVSALAEAPLTRLSVAALQGALAAAGVVYGAVIAWRLTHRNAPHWSDYWCYGYAPLAAYVALVGAAAAVALGADWGPRAVAAVLMSVLLLAIRNAWDLVTWLAPGGDTSSDGT